MRKLLYLFSVCLLAILMGACHDNRHCLDKAEAMFRVDNDSMQYYLLKVDTTSLTLDEWCDYQYLRLFHYKNLMSLGYEELDSILGILGKHFIADEVKTFRLGIIRIVYSCYRSMDYEKADSLLDVMSLSHCSRKDSVTWYGYKCHVKKSLHEIDSLVWYIHEMFRFGWENNGNLHYHLGNVYVMRNRLDSAIIAYQKALEQDTTMNAVHNRNRILDLALKMGDRATAWKCLEQLREQMKRTDVPYMNLVEGNLWMEMHRPDSAMKHYRIAAETGNDYIASQAYERLAMIAQAGHDWDKAFDLYQKSVRSKNELYKSSIYEQDKYDFEKLKLKNLVNELKVEQQSYVILILGLVLLVVIMIGGSVFFLIYRRRVDERNRLLQENVVLKQQEELSVLREKDARMREELLKRMNVFRKISETEKEKHIQLSDADWKEIQLMLDSGYNDFTRKLRMKYPLLPEKDINFCCLVKINMSLQSMADIYCISKNSVSRRKLRLKEKLGVGEEETLDEFLGRLE